MARDGSSKYKLIETAFPQPRHIESDLSVEKFD